MDGQEAAARAAGKTPRLTKPNGSVGGGDVVVLLRQEIGDVLRDARRQQGRTLREVSSVARVSLGYLSEVERGQKEASSELLASICGDRKSTRLNSSHANISYAVFCLKKKK